MFHDPGNLCPVNEGDDHLDVAPGTLCVKTRHPVIFLFQKRDYLLIGLSGCYDTDDDPPDGEFLIDHHSDVRSQRKPEREPEEHRDIGDVGQDRLYGKQPDHDLKECDDRGEVFDPFRDIDDPDRLQAHVADLGDKDEQRENDPGINIRTYDEKRQGFASSQFLAFSRRSMS
jgi:hypothetical protein